MKKTYAILGTGAVGGYYGAVLARAGHEVHFLARSDYEHIRQHGISIRSFLGDFTIDKPLVHKSIDTIPPCDAVIVASKATANTELFALVPAVLKQAGTVLLFQNGYGEEDRLAAAAGTLSIISGLCFIGAAKIGPGLIEHQASGGISMAMYAPEEKSAGITAELSAIAAEFTAAGVAITLEEDWILARWKKLVWNIPFNGLSVLLHTDTHSLLNNPASRSLVISLMHEVALGAKALGRTIEEEFIERMISYTEKMPAYLPSMRLDWDRGKALEVQAMYSNPVAAAKSRGIELPRIEALGHELSFLMNRKQQYS